MGGGTTVVEALRLGCKVIGIDLNPVAWFIVKTETTPVDIKELERAFDDLANRIVPWSGKPLEADASGSLQDHLPMLRQPRRRHHLRLLGQVGHLHRPDLRQAGAAL